MSAVTAPRVTTVPIVSHWAWLAGGFAMAFAIPFVLADVLEIHRDVYYGLYATAVLGLIGLWARSTGYDLEAAARRRWPLAIGLGAACAGVMALMVVRTDDPTARPDGVELAGAVLWRGVVYGISDGLLLSVFPILLVFAALAGSRLNDRTAGKVVIGGIALITSLAMTAVYHLGYSDFRSDKLAKPLVGDVLWSVPTLVTLNRSARRSPTSACTSPPCCTATTRTRSCRRTPLLRLLRRRLLPGPQQISTGSSPGTSGSRPGPRRT